MSKVTLSAMRSLHGKSSGLAKVTIALFVLLTAGNLAAQSTNPDSTFRSAGGFTRGNQPSGIVRYVHHDEFPAAVREKMQMFNAAFARPDRMAQMGQASCPQTQRFAQGILNRLLSGSNLGPAMIRSDYPITMVVTCAIADFPDAEMKAGALTLSAELILLLQSEDEIAAVLAHEVAHFTLAHEHKKLENWHRINEFEMNRMRIRHEEEADAESLVLLVNSGYDPNAAVGALKALRKFMDATQSQSDKSHPHINYRIKALVTEINRASFAKVPHRDEGLEAVKYEVKRRPQTLLVTREN
jgi:predicted Zn-dependent protease